MNIGKNLLYASVFSLGLQGCFAGRGMVVDNTAQRLFIVIDEHPWVENIHPSLFAYGRQFIHNCNEGEYMVELRSCYQEQMNDFVGQLDMVHDSSTVTTELFSLEENSAQQFDSSGIQIRVLPYGYGWFMKVMDEDGKGIAKVTSSGFVIVAENQPHDQVVLVSEFLRFVFSKCVSAREKELFYDCDETKQRLDSTPPTTRKLNGNGNIGGESRSISSGISIRFKGKKKDGA